MYGDCVTRDRDIQGGMHIKFDSDSPAAPESGPIIYAYFKPGLVGIVFERDEEGFMWGGRPDDELPDLFWFKIVDDCLMTTDKKLRSWELVA